MKIFGPIVILSVVVIRDLVVERWAVVAETTIGDAMRKLRNIALSKRKDA